MFRIKSVMVTLSLLMVNLTFGQIGSQLDNYLQNSDLIVEAKVINQTIFEDQGNIFTSYEVEIFKQFKGDNLSKRIHIIRVGGSFENEGLMVYPSTELNIEESGIFLLSPINHAGNESYRLTSASNSYLSADYIENKVYGSILEKGYMDLDVLYNTVKRKVGNEIVVMKQVPSTAAVVSRNMMIQSIDKLDICAGCGDLIKITGAGFLANRGDFGAVLFTNANMSSNSNTIAAINYVSWSDSEIQLIVPSNAGSGSIVVRNKLFQKSPKSIEKVHVKYNLMNTPKGFEIRLIDDESDGDWGYKFQFSNETANNGVDFTSLADATNIVYEAFSKFNKSAPNFAVYMDDACPTVPNQIPSNDNVNLISFDNDLWDLDMMVGDNSYGAVYMRWIKCGNSEPEVVDIDIIIRRDGDPNLMLGRVNWNFGDTSAGKDAMDFNSVIMHQLGHAMLLGHVRDSNMLMHFNLDQGETKRDLSLNDSEAAARVHTSSKAYDPPMVNCLYQFSQERKYGDYDSSKVCDFTILAIQTIDLKVEKLNNNTALLNFVVTGEKEFGTYEIYKKNGFTDYILVESIQAKNDNSETAYRYEDKNVMNGNSTYRIQVINENGTIISSNEVNINFELNDKVIILQNPVVNNLLHLQIPFNLRDQLYEIFDMNGKLRLENKLQETILIDQLEQGTYFIQTKSGGVNDIVKFVKI